MHCCFWERELLLVMQIQPCFMKILFLLFTSVPTDLCPYQCVLENGTHILLLRTLGLLDLYWLPQNVSTKSQHLVVGSALCEAALSPETQAKLGEGAEVFSVTFGDTECACAQIHIVCALASSSCCRQFPFLWGEINSIFVFFKIPFSFLNYANWNGFFFPSSGCIVLLYILPLGKPDIHLYMWSLLSLVTVFILLTLG